MKRNFVNMLTSIKMKILYSIVIVQSLKKKFISIKEIFI